MVFEWKLAFPCISTVSRWTYVLPERWQRCLRCCQSYMTKLPTLCVLIDGENVLVWRLTATPGAISTWAVKKKCAQHAPCIKALNSCHCHANMFWRLVVSNIKTRFWSSLQLRNQWSCKELVKGNHLPKPSSHGLAPVLPDRQVARDTRQICGGDTKPTMWGGVAQVRISSHHSSWQNQALNNSTVQYFSLTQQATQPMQPKDSKCISKKGSKLASPSASSGHTTSPRCGR